MQHSSIALKTLFILLLSVSLFTEAKAQTQTPPPNPRAARAAMVKAHEPQMIYPFIKGSYLTGVLPVTNPTEKIDPSMNYNLLFDLTLASTDTAKGLNNEGIEEIIRLLNLHVAAGVPLNKLHAVIVVHSGAVMSFLKADVFEKKFNRPNPNADLIQQLMDKGVRIAVCGQTMQYRNLETSDLMTGINKAYSARTALSTYMLKGYARFEISED